MAFHCVATSSNCVISRTEYSFVSQQSVMSALGRKARFLSPNRISELVWDSESEDAGAQSDSFYDDEGGFEDESGVSHLQPGLPKFSGQASSSSFSSIASDEGEVFQSGPGQQVQHHARHSGQGPLALIEV